MDEITYTSARANLARTMDRVCEDHEPLIITRSGEQSVVNDEHRMVYKPEREALLMAQLRYHY